MRSDLRWFTSSSVIDTTWLVIMVAAALVVVSDDDDLFVLAEARFPTNFCTAPAAEVFGLLLATTNGVVTPHVSTDCKSLLTTASAGTFRATAAARPLASAWGTVAASTLIASGKLQWTPAHKSRHAAERLRASDGQLASTYEVRSSHLAGAIARRCARARGLAAPRGVAERLKLAADALRIEAGTLDAITTAAKKHDVSVCT